MKQGKLALRKILALQLIGLLAIMPLSACGDSSGTPSATPSSEATASGEPGGTVAEGDGRDFGGATVLLNLNQPADALREDFDAWIAHLQERALNEFNINLEYETVSWGDYLNKHLMSIANSDGPDIIQMGSGVPSVVAAADGLLDLTPYMDQLGGFDVYFDVGKYYAQYNGEIIAIPWGGGGRVTYYNKTIYDEAGLDYPVNDWSWESFVSDVQALTDHMGRPAYAVHGASNDVTYNFWANVVTDGGRILSEDESTAAFNDDAGVLAVRKILDLYDSGLIPSSFAESTVDDNLPAFINGEAALAYGSASWWMDVIQVMDEDDFGVVTMPTGSTGLTTGAVTMSEFGVMKYTKDPDATISVLSIIISPEEIVASTSILGWVPFRNDLKDDPAYTQYPFFETFFHNAENSVLHIPQVASVSTVLSSSTKTLNDIYAEAVTGKSFTDEELKQRLDALAQEVDNML